MMDKYRVTKNMLNGNISNTCSYIVNQFSPSDDILYKGTFARSITFNRQCPDFLSSQELGDILLLICTE